MHSQVTELVETCARYPSGVEALLEAVRWFEGASFAMAALDAYFTSLSAGA